MEKISKEDINLEEWEYEFNQRDSHPILMADFWCRSAKYGYGKKAKLPIQGMDYVYTYSNKGYVKVAQKKQLMEELKKAIEKQEYVQYIFEGTLKFVEELEKFVEEITEKIEDNLSSHELSELWKEFDKVFLSGIPWFFIPYYVVEKNMLTDRVKKGLEKHKQAIEKITDFNNALMVLIFPTKEVELRKEQKAFYELVKIAKQKEFEKKAQEYLDKYAWMKTFILLPIEPLSMEELKERVENALKDNSLEQYEQQEKQREKNEKLAKKLLEKISDDKELVFQIEWARNYGWLLTASVEQLLRAFAKLIPFYKLIAKKIGVKYNQWIHLTSEEIVGMLKEKTKISQEELDERDLGHFYMMMENGQAKMAVGKQGKEISEWFEKNVDAVDTKIDKVKGSPACSGHVKGKVHIAMLAKDSYNIQKGEILICSMTSPDYVPAMKKAAAIVTDEGGLLSHASIVSRELGKPCVVGTKIASKVFKDGDTIEVNAEEGVVKIIKRA